MVRALDISNYTGPITPAQVQCWQGRNAGLVIVGTQDPGIAEEQLATVRNAGLPLEAYVYLYWRGDVADQVRQALDTIRGYPVRRLWLDCEDNPRGLSGEEVCDRIQTAIAATGEFPCGIYTGRWWWPNTGGSMEFSYLPLWHAEYLLESGQAPSDEYRPDFGAFTAYGGWTRPTMWQYAGSVPECGLTVDLNAVEDVPALAPPEPVLTPTDVIMALVSAAEFTRRGWSYADLIERDKVAIRSVAGQL